MEKKNEQTYKVAFDLNKDMQKTNTWILSPIDLKRVIIMRRNLNNFTKSGKLYPYFVQDELLTHGYEVLKDDNLIPFFDIEKKYPYSSEDNYLDQKTGILNETLNILKKQFPTGKFYIEECNRIITEKNKDKFKISYHIKIRNVGYVRNPLMIKKWLDSIDAPTYFDRTVYKQEGKLQYFRMINNSKIEDNSKIFFLNPIDEKSKKLTIGSINIEDYMIQNTKDEKYECEIYKCSDSKLEKYKSTLKDPPKYKQNNLDIYKIQTLLNNIPNNDEGVRKDIYDKVLYSLKYESMKGLIDSNKLKEEFIKWAKKSKKEGTKQGSSLKWDKCTVPIDDEAKEINSYATLLYIAKQFNPKLSLPKGKYVDHRIFESDAGLSEIYISLVKDDIIIINNKGSGYLWCPINCIWKFYKSGIESATVTQILVPYIDSAIQMVRKLRIRSKEYDQYLKPNKNYNNDLDDYNLEDLDDKSISDLEDILEKDDITDLRKINLIESLNKIKKKVQSTIGSKSIFEKSYIFLMNDELYKKLDNNSYLFPIKNNKCVNIKTSEIIPRIRSHYFTKTTTNEFDPHIPLTEVNKYLLQLFNTQDNVNYIQKVLGSFLSLDNDKTFYYFYGPKANNGKSTFILTCIENIFQSFYTPLDLDVVIKPNKKNSGAATPALMMLDKKRVGIISETEKGDKANSSLIKALTGGDNITKRGLFKDMEEVRNSCHIVIQSNRLLDFEHNDFGLKNRWRIIPFENVFIDESLDQKQKDIMNENSKQDDDKYNLIDSDREKMMKFQQEQKIQIFSFIIKGAKSYYESKMSIKVPEYYQTYQKKAFNNHEPINIFLDRDITECIGSHITQNDLYTCYQSFCYETNIKPKEKVEFEAFLKCKYKYLKHGRQIQYQNIKFISD